MTSQHVYNNKVRDEVEWRTTVVLAINYSTQTRKNEIYLFYIQLKFKWFIEGFLMHEKRKNKSADVDLTPSVCVL